MFSRVGIVGIGYEGFRPVVSDLSTREMMFEACSKAYEDANIDPRKDVSSFISCDEDLWEGWSITDEMVPDQMGGARRPVCTVSGDGLLGIANAAMQISAGIGDLVVVETHSKVADVLTKEEVERLALEPSYIRPVADADTLAALEMSYYMNGRKVERSLVDEVVAEEKRRGLKNPRASFSARLERTEISSSEEIVHPLKRLDKADYAEASVAVVLASERWIKKEKKDAIFIDGIAWNSSLPWYEDVDWKSRYPEAKYLRESFKKCCKDAGIKEDMLQFDVVEIDDQYSYKLLQHIDALLQDGKESRNVMEKLPANLNPSSGYLSLGNFVEASSLARVLEAVLQLRGEAGKMQLKRTANALIASWRGIPTSTGGVIILSR
ncbi:MAG: hypothetical protein QXX17_06720 [Conexivisphaerales archaeon]